MKPTARRIKVTVLTGFLGAGKTTLMNRILTENHGKRIAVIENEFGEIGIDHELVINAEEEIFEMNNGCICCTVRGDLIRILGNLLKRRDRFDHILIETTGLADPGPVVQTFFVDDEVKEHMFINAVVTLVDAKHISQHIDDSDEAKEQIAFADVILLNKCDLVTPADLDRLEARIITMNGMAKLHRTTNADIAIDKVLDVGGFNLDHAMTVDPRFLDPEYPFEWGGVFEWAGKGLTWTADINPDPSMKMAIVPVEAATEEELARAREIAVRHFSANEIADYPSGREVSDEGIFELVLEEGKMEWPVSQASGGWRAVFTEHFPDELDLQLLENGKPVPAVLSVAYKPDHEHDDTVSSVGIETDKDCDPRRLEAWLSQLLREQGNDIFRMKGVFAVQGNPRRAVFQGVHMLFDAQDGGPWGDRPRRTSLVFIGRNLDRNALNESFSKCLI
ncbi:MAG: GTP-binding protein [Terrimicrobiaceae bacterium]